MGRAQGGEVVGYTWQHSQPMILAILPGMFGVGKVWRGEGELFALAFDFE
jgi:hypothetical protein